MACHAERPTEGVRIPLTVIRPAKPPRTKLPRRRFWVLLGVNVFMVLHLVQWLAMGVTFAPVEPSEAMETVKEGIVTVGAVFFGVAILSTAILGRWFCGWGCHVVALQDGSLWLLRKFGIRPRPFRSRLLMLVPVLLALYMFAWPPLYRFAIAPYVRPEVAWPEAWTGFVAAPVLVTDFWRTFPGVLVAIPFLLVCGFLCVYFLGAKGYCTYGCPYGGIFGPVDEIAPGRIVVNDSCEGCGHCTAVCTSNVRVHEEVATYGMVVDPGCMKCLDCVSTCPNEALSFGFAKPAVFRERKGEASRKPRAYDLTMREELAFALVALVTFFSVRGAYGVVPLLFASGITAIVTFVTWKAWRMVRDPNSRFRDWALTVRGEFTRAGIAWMTATILMLVLVAHSGVVNGATVVAGWLYGGVRTPPEVVFGGNPMEPDAATRRRAEWALRLYRASRFIGDGGLGLLPGWRSDIEMREAWLQSVLLRFDRAEWTVRRGIRREGLDENRALVIARVLRAQGREADMFAWYAEVLAERPEFETLNDEWLMALRSAGRSADAVVEARAAVARQPDSLLLLRRLSLLLMEDGTPEETEEGIRLTERTLELEPDNPFAYRALALGHAKQGRLDESERAWRRAIELAPDDWRLRQAFGEFLMSIDRAEEGAAEIRRGALMRQAAESGTLPRKNG